MVAESSFHPDKIYLSLPGIEPEAALPNINHRRDTQARDRETFTDPVP